jgi:hypothetical protein
MPLPPRGQNISAERRRRQWAIECEPCGRRGRYNVAKLIEKYGDMKLPELRHVLANCQKARSFSVHDQCKVKYGEDSRLS